MSVDREVSLRKTIADAAPVRAQKVRRRRITVTPERKLPVPKIALAAGAGVLVVVGIVATAFSTVTPGESIDKSIIRSGSAHTEAATVTTLDSRALTSDGGKVNRSSIIGLGGKVVPADREPVTEEARAPARLQAPRLKGMSDAYGPATLGTASAEAAAEPVASIVVARANIVWARVFREIGVSYIPVGHQAAGRWEAGPCADMLKAPGPSYCKNNHAVYLREKDRVDAVAMLEIAHEVGHHVQDMLGVMIRPLSGDAHEFQADCFAGLWASRAPDIASDLTPETLAPALAGDFALSLWDKSRIEAFTQGYVARTPTDCAGLSTAWLTENGG